MQHLQIFLPDSSQQTFEIVEEKTTVGRVEGNTLRLEDPSVSSHHAEIIMANDQFQLRDLGSTNGTFVNGQQVTEATLNLGDEIRFGAVVCLFSGQESAAADVQPLPVISAPATHAGSESGRPQDFVCSSPIPRNQKKKDPVALAALVVGVVALLGAATAAILGLALSV